MSAGKKGKPHKPVDTRSLFELTVNPLRMDDCRKAFAANNRKALFDAIALCALSKSKMPDWVSAAFLAGYIPVANYMLGSWDAAFGKPYNQNANWLRGERKRFDSSVNMYLAVEAVRKDTDMAIDEALFNEVAKRLELGKVNRHGEWSGRFKVSKLYYHALDRISPY